MIFQSSNHAFSTNNSDLRARRRRRRRQRKSQLFELSNSDLSTSNVDIPDTSNCDLGASNGHVSDSSNLDLLYEFVTKSGCHGTWPNHDKCMAMELHTWAAVTVMHTVMWVCIVCSLLGMFQAVSANFASPSLDSQSNAHQKFQRSNFKLDFFKWVTKGLKRQTRRKKEDSDCGALTIYDDTRLALWLSTTRDAATRGRCPSCFDHRDMRWPVFCGQFLTRRRVSGSELSHADSATYNCRTCSSSASIGVDRRVS